jgi:hypothetical protein
MPKEIGKCPSAFSGDTRTSTGWALQLEAYLALNKGVYDDDEKKVIFALSLMTKGEAAKWAEAKLKKATAEKSYGTFEDFAKALKANFFPKNLEQTAIKRISTLKQTGSVAAYVSLFRTIIADTSIVDEQTKILFFRNGLKPQITTTILGFETLPKTVEDWMEKALDIEVRRTFTSNAPYVTKKDPYAMDIDRAEVEDEEEEEAPRTRKTYLSPQEREKRRKNGLCFKCGKKGLIKDCPNHPTVTTVKKTQTAAKPAAKTDDADYQEFLEWKAFKARQAKKQSEEADFA